jgi:phosphoribosyl 1,2-cyclic phosphodiesterase
MRARIWGCRGSLATPGEATRRYGGNTPSIEVRSAADELVVLDAGTGIRNLGLTLRGECPSEIHLLLTHMHLDHVEGLGFFAPIFDERCTISIWGPRPRDRSLAEHIRAYLSPPLFPLEFADIPARFVFNEVWEDRWQLNGLSITSQPVNHPGPTVGYRVEEDGQSLGFIPDNEIGLDSRSGFELAAGVDVLLHDCQYTCEEYRTRVSWGHASIDHLAAYAREAQPRRLLMFHHDPSHSDDVLESMRTEAEHQAGRPVELAAEGLELVVGAGARA